MILVLLLLFPSPLFILSGQLGSKSLNNAISSQKSNEESTLHLFTYKHEEMEEIMNYFVQNFNKVPKFFQNVQIGMVSITEEEYTDVRSTFGLFSSRMQTSSVINVLPSIEELNIQRIRASSQGLQLPSSIVNASVQIGKGYDGSGIKIAILDSGIDTTHPDIDNVGYQESFILPEYGFSSEEGTSDLHGHGTHVTGIAAASGSYPGIAPGSEIVNLKVADMFGGASSAAVIAALDKAIELNVDVVSISLGFGLTDPWGSENVLDLAVNSAVEHGIIVVVSAGNEADSSTPFMTINTPASAQKAITVGATNGSENVVRFSSQGPTFDFRPDPDLVAPGYQIIGPLASGGVIDLAYNALVDVSIVDYVILSGTSMAAPVVSGAVALLLDQFPNASPYAIRAALQESATDLGESETIYTQGAGLINVGLAAEELERTQISSGFEIISTNPRANDRAIEFFHPARFPGDQAEFTLPFVTGSAGTITWEISGEISSFIEFDTTPTVIPSAKYFEKLITIDIPLNVPSGLYQGDIGFSFGTKDYELPISIEVLLPKDKLYWDTYHTGVDDSYFLNYRSFNQYIQGPNHRYDIDDYTSPIVNANLTQSGILVLTDLENPLTSREIKEIKNFHNNNGSILMMTSFLPYFNLDPYEKIVKALNLPINLSDNREFVNYVDNGRERYPVPWTLSLESLEISLGNPFLKDVEELPKLGENAFYGNMTDESLTHYAQIDDHLLLASIEKSNKGKVLILGTENWLAPSYLQSTSGEIFTTNILKWLSPDQPAFNVRFDPLSNDIEIAVYPESAQNFSLSIELANGTKISNIAVFYDQYLNFSYRQYKLNSVEGVEIKANIFGDHPEKFNVTFNIFLSSSNLPLVEEILVGSIDEAGVQKPSWWEESETLVDTGLILSVNHSTSARISATALIFSQYQKSLDVILPPLTSPFFEVSYVDEINFTNESLELKSALWDKPDGLLTGYYSYEVQVWWKNEFNQIVLLESIRETFFVPDTEPEIHIDQSYVGDLTINDHRNILTFEDLPKWKPGEQIDIYLQLLDVESSHFEVYYQLLHYYLFAADRIVLNTHILYPTSSDSSIHSGIFSVPDLPIPLPDEEGFEVELVGEYFVLLFFIRDAQGNSIIEPIFFQISSAGAMDMTLVIVVVLFALVATGVIVFLLQRNQRRMYDPYSYHQTRTQEVSTKPKSSLHKYCINCGQRLAFQAQYCPYCGKILNFDYENQ